MNRSIFVSFILISILHNIKSFDIRDCTYNSTNYHIEYICEGESGSNYGSRTKNFLFCNNFSAGIDRSEVLDISFRECKGEQFSEYFVLSSFKILRTFDVSFAELKYLRGNMFEANHHLEKFIASHNHFTEIPGEFFSYTIELNSLDLSYNQIHRVDSFIFDNTRKLKTIQFSYNAIEKIYKRLFANLPELENLDFSNNRITHIESDLLSYNTNLKHFNLNNNQVVRLNCDFLITLTPRSLDISLNTLEEIGLSCSKDGTHIDFDVNISPSELATTLRVFDNRLKWIFSKGDFLKLRYLNCSNSHMKNLSVILQETSTQIETLDLSNTFVGELNESTFQRFVNLKKLNLSRTNLSNLQFATFYHQRNPEMLDISYNNLNKIDFYLFLRNFQNLISLNLEGNNLTDIDSITRTHFPKLTNLAISKNSFSCDYLTKFLLQWPDLKLIDNPSNQTHIGGVDCLHRSTNQTDSYPNTVIERHVDNKNGGSIYPNHHQELFTIQILLILIILLISLSFVARKGKRLLESARERLMQNSDDHYVAYNPNNAIHIQQDLLTPLPLEQKC